MISHNFEKDLDCHKVKCLKTGGSFSTKLWWLGKVKRGQCPCCNRTIQKR